MYIFKVLRGGKDKVADVSVRSVERGWLISQLTLPPTDHPGLRPAMTAFRETVAKIEAGFLSSLKPSAAAADFAREEDARVVEFNRLLSGMVGVIGEGVGSQKGGGGLSVSVPLLALLPDPQGFVANLVSRLVQRHFDGSGKLVLGAGLAKLTVANLCKASKVTEAQARERPHRLKWPKESGLPLEKQVAVYLAGTGFDRLVLTSVEMTIPDATRYQHTLLVAGSGAGKTRTIERMVLADLARSDRPGIVVIDDQGDVIERLRRLKCFANSDRLLVVDGGDVLHPIMLNLFDMPEGGGVDAMNRRVELASFVVEGLFDAAMTEKQSTTFRFLTELMLSIRGNLHTLLDCLGHPEKYQREMQALGGMAGDFLLQEFSSTGFKSTRGEIRRRLLRVMGNKSFAAMFGAKENRLDIQRAIDDGRVVLVNTARSVLGEECRVLGRFAIALLMQAAFARAHQPPHERRPTFIYIDEAASYMDENVARMLSQVRKYNMSMTLAIQGLGQLPDSLRGIVMGNCATKLAAGVAGRDARYLAEEMNTTPEFIMAQSKSNGMASFATFVRGLTPVAMSWKIPLAGVDREPVMTESERAAIDARNRRELSS